MTSHYYLIKFTALFVSKVTHGFPKNPAPLFRSISFPIENRPGLENQDIQVVLQELYKRKAFEVQNSKQGTAAKDVAARVELARWLSDWHFITFMETVDLFSPVSCS